MACGIYKITNQINGKVYIGQSIDIYRRWRNEKVDAFNSNSCAYDYALSRAFRKYGIENFTFEILEECQPSQLNEREKYFANYFNAYIPNGYNTMLCGEHQSCLFKLESFDDVDNIIRDLKETTLTGAEICRKYNLSSGMVSGINKGRYWRKDNISYPIRPEVAKKENKCLICGKIISNNATHCTSCSQKLQQVCERPDKETLFKDIATSSFSAVGKKYGVTDNAIRKWCKAYGLPTHTKELKDLYTVEVLHEQLKEPKPKPHVLQINPTTGEVIAEFKTSEDACRAIGGNTATHIREVCRGLAETAYGYKWKYSD